MLLNTVPDSTSGTLEQAESPCDAFSGFYERDRAEPFLLCETGDFGLLLHNLNAGARILDVCCGRGPLSRWLTNAQAPGHGSGFSGEMLLGAAASAQHARFVQADAADCMVPESADAAVCTFDSVNHITGPHRLAGLFAGVACGEPWKHVASVVEQDNAFILRRAFDPLTVAGSTNTTTFRLLDVWHRAHVDVTQRVWGPDKLQPMLLAAAFGTVEAFHPAEDLGIASRYAIGRIYRRARR
jgi:SAM-dependent methyltransferase